MFGFLTLRDFFVVSKTQFAILALTSAVVISLELVNTAVEKAVDLACGEKKHNLAKIAKDACAGAVLVSAIAAVIIGVLILYQPDAFSAMYAYYKSNLMYLLELKIVVFPSMKRIYIYLVTHIPNRKKTETVSTILV